jgi:predicted ATPase
MAKPISRLTIRGFKSIKALEGFELRPLNILIGANGAGKSNFVAFFAMLQAMVKRNLEGYVREHGEADAHLFLGPKRTKRISGELEFPPNRYSFSLKRTVKGKFYFERETSAFEDHEYVLGTGHAESKLWDRRDAVGKWGGPSVESYVCDSVSSWTVYHFHDTSDTAAVRGSGTVRDYERLRPNGENLAAFLLRLRDNDESVYTSIRDTIRLVAPFFDDFKLRPEPNGQDDTVLLEWTQQGSDYPFHPSQLSDGTLRFICLATALLQPEPPAAMLFDEPELGLHPFALSVLGGLLRQASTRTQVIVSTQSASLLDCFEPEDVVVVDRRDGASEFRRLERAALDEWLDEYSLGELWQKNVFRGGPAHE